MMSAGLLKSEERFPTVNFRSDLLDVEVLIEMLVEGRYIKTNIQRSINGSIQFRNMMTCLHGR